MDKRRFKHILKRGLSAVATCAAILGSVDARTPDRDAIVVSPPPAGGDFRLESNRGAFTLSSLRGQVVLLFFGYVTCPDVCPTTLGTLQQAFDALSAAERRRVHVVFVSVDPQRDKPALLDQYVGAFSLPAVGVTGTPDQIDQVAGRYGAQYRRVALRGGIADAYAIEHSAAVYLIDGGGQLRSMLRHTAAPARFVTEIRRLMHGAG